MNIFLPDSFVLLHGREAATAQQRLPLPKPPPREGLGKGTNNMAKMWLHNRLTNEFHYNFTENPEDLSADVRIIPETEMLFSQKDF